MACVRSTSCVLMLSASAMSVLAQEPQQTTAVYDDWVLQCSLFAAEKTAAKEASEKTANPTEKPGAAETTAKPAEKLPTFVAPRSARSCEIVQTFVMRETGGTLAKLAIGKLPGQEEIKGVLIAPLGVFLADSPVLKLEGGKEVKGIYTRCGNSGCIAEFSLSKELVAEMRTAKALTLGFSTSQRVPLTLNVSPKGFSYAFDAAVAQN